MKNLIKNISLPLLIGITVGIITQNFNDYKDLIAPPLAPKAILFPIIWTILYILMGISTYIISKKDKVPSIYYINLFFNAIWSIIFFAFKLRLFASIWLFTLIVIIIIMLKEFKKISKKAYLLQIPYLIWSIFALYLNIGYFILN